MEGLLKRVLALFSITLPGALAYAVLLYITRLPLSLTIAPIATGAIMGLVSTRAPVLGGRDIILAGLIAGILGAIAIPLGLGSLNLHLLVAGEYLTTPIASALQAYHGITTALAAYIVARLVSKSGELARPSSANEDKLHEEQYQGT